MNDTASANDRFIAAFDAYLDEAGVADALSAATTIFVSLVVGYTKARGHNEDQPITINGGENRDITIHPPKAANRAVKKETTMATDTASAAPVIGIKKGEGNGNRPFKRESRPRAAGAGGEGSRV